MAERQFKVVVVGAGIAGLFMAEKLKRAGIDFTVFEKADEVGGTWRDNTYPGLFVDVLSRQYEFPFQPNYDWSRKYAPATEIQAYVKKVAADAGLAQIHSVQRRDRRAQIHRRSVASEDRQGRNHRRGRVRRRDRASCTSRSIRTFPDATALPARRFIPRAGTTACRIRESAGALSAAAPAASRSPRRWPGSGCEVTQFIRRAQWVHIRENPQSTWRERLLLRLAVRVSTGASANSGSMIIEVDQWRLKPGPQREAMEREYKGYLNAIRDPELRTKADARLSSRLHAHSEVGPKLLRGRAAAERPHRVWTHRAHRAQRRRDGRRHAPRSSTCWSMPPASMPHAYMRPMKVTGAEWRDASTKSGRTGSIPMAGSRCRDFRTCSCCTGRSAR